MTAVAYARPCPTPARRRPDVSASIRVAKPVAIGISSRAQPWVAPRPRASVYRRRRILAAVVLTASLLVGWSGVSALGLAPGATAPLTSRGSVVHVVRPGDTLWSIAREVQPEGDVRPLVDHLVTAHGSAAVEVGERIVVPAP